MISQECYEGDSATFEAVIISTPPPHEVHWFFNQNLLVNSQGCHIIHEGDVFKLFLHNLDAKNHSGVIMVKAANTAGSAQSSASLFVKQKVEKVKMKIKAKNLIN